MTKFIIGPIKLQIFGVVASKTSEAVDLLGRNNEQKEDNSEEPGVVGNHSVLTLN